MRSLEELIDHRDSATALVTDWIRTSRVDVRVLPRVPERANDTLVRLQVTTRSVLGSIAYDCAGLVLDHGWLRLLACGGAGLPSIAEANHLPLPAPGVTAPTSILLGWDVLGGCFAIDGGAYGATPGNVCYFAPDTLEWEDLDIGHSAFVEWALSGRLADFAADLRWRAWEEDVRDTGLDCLLQQCPPPWTVEGSRAHVSRQPIPVAEALSAQADVALQLRGVVNAPRIR